MTEFVPPLLPLYDLAGLDRPLTLTNGLERPGLAHPPPGRGDGLRDNDMGRFGVPGIVSSVEALRDGSCESRSFETWMFKPSRALGADADDRRRWWVKELPMDEEKAAEGFKDASSND